MSRLRTSDVLLNNDIGRSHLTELRSPDLKMEITLCIFHRSGITAYQMEIENK